MMSTAPGTQDAIAAADRRTSLRLLWDLMAGGRALAVGAATAVLMATVCAHIAPLVLRGVIDSVIGETPAEFFPADLWQHTRPMLRSRLWIAAAALVLLAAAQAYFDYARGYWSAAVAERFACRLRRRLHAHVNRIPLQRLGRLRAGDLIQRCTSDVETVRLFLESQIPEIARIALMVLVSAPIMLYLDVRMTLASVALLPIVIAASTYYFFRVSRLYEQTAAAEADLSAVLQENLSGVRLVKAFGREATERERFDARNEAYRDGLYTMMRSISVYWGGSAFLCMLQISLVLVFGAWRAAQGTLTIGTLTVFLSYVALLVWPIRMLGHVLSDAGRTAVSLARVAGVLGEPAEAEEPEAQRPEILGRIEFDRVGFVYGDGTPGLQDVSFVVEPGETVAVIGRTGAGKSTLVQLIPRLLDYTSGHIRIDGCELNAIDREWIRAHVGIVLQEPFLFSKSLRDNIRMRDPNEPEHRVLEAAHIAHIHNTIEGSFEQGYDTIVGEKGVTLSGGQRQRVAIARALLGQPAILIMDDALSAVDTETDAAIRAKLATGRRPTTLVVSHRISTVSQADRIVVLDAGRVTACGTHAELAARPGLYRRFLDIQNMLETDLDQALASE